MKNRLNFGWIGILSALAFTLQAADWPLFRGDRGLTGAATGQLPEKLSLLWKFDAKGPVKASAVIANGMAYVGGDDDGKKGLKGKLYAIDLATDGEEGHFLGSTENYDAIVLDLGLPEIDGLTVLDRWRKEGKTMPVLVLTARDSWSDKVAGLDAGADDYVAKPFQTEELIARLRALIRRASGNASSELTAGDVRLDTRSGKVTKAGEPVKLTAQEYKLLSYLLHHKGKVVSRTELIEHIYDQDFDRDSNTIEVFVTRIRKKLGQDVITTIRGLGYSLEDPDA